VYPSVPFDPLRSFAPVVQTVRAAQLIAARAGLPAADLAGFLALARQRPVTVGTPGNGSIGHLLLEMVRAATGAPFVHVPYRGGGPAIADLLAGHIDAVSLTLAAVVQQVRAGRARGIAVSTAARDPALPEVPTLAEGGVAGIDVVSWQGLLAPAGTDAAILARLNAAVNQVLAMPEVAQQLAGMGLIVVGGPPERLAQLLAADVARWPAVVRAAGVKLD
jgi:tripartite-type tricarboxylate transporter receptor subunit TctC